MHDSAVGRAIVSHLTTPPHAHSFLGSVRRLQPCRRFSSSEFSRPVDLVCFIYYRTIGNRGVPIGVQPQRFIHLAMPCCPSVQNAAPVAASAKPGNDRRLRPPMRSVPPRIVETARSISPIFRPPRVPPRSLCSASRFFFFRPWILACDVLLGRRKSTYQVRQ